MRSIFKPAQLKLLIILAAQLPPTFTTNAPDPTLPLQEHIAALEEENKLLTIKVETLMAVMGKG